MGLRQRLYFFRNAVADLLFPRVCGFCTEPLEESEFPVCPDCWTTIRRVERPYCRQCGRPILGSLLGDYLCGTCLVENPPYLKARYAVYHEGDMRQALINFKYHEALHCGSSLAQLLIEAFHTHFETSRIDSIIPIPLHPKRLYSRGYNQVVLLGETLSSTTGIPLDRTSLAKIKDKPPQVGLPRKDRIRNVRGSFRIYRREGIEGKRVLIIDDVATTGATVDEAAGTVLRSGATRVYVLVLALALRHQWRDSVAPQDADGPKE
jgi:ComF family protein